MRAITKTIYKIIGIIFTILIISGCQPAGSVSPMPTTLTLLSHTVTSIPPSATQPLTPTVTLMPTLPATPFFTATSLPGPAVSSESLFPLIKSPQEFDSRGTYQIGLGDLDGDGDLDGVFSNPLKHNSEVWLNDGNGTFVDTGQKLTQYGHGVGIADFDDDGDLDAFIACHQFITPSKIYLNDGSGNFQDTGQDLGDRGMSGSELHLLDLNGDGHIDAHILYYDPNGLPDKVYLNDGAANFTDSGLALDEDTIAWGDLDGDGDVDYFGKLWGRGYVVQFNDGSGNFSEGWQTESEQTTIGGIALADFDGDGDLDALVANGFRETGSFPSLLFWNDGFGQFTQRVTSA
jgi:hypothetical protein